MQQSVMAAMEQRLVDAISSIDPQKLMDQWMPFGAKSMEQWGSVWSQLAQTAAGFPRAKPTDKT
jgi:hypothetical protein